MEDRRFGFLVENLLTPAEAVATFFARAQIGVPEVEYVALDDSHGRILAERIDADRDYPDAPRSAMDGFAVRSSSVPGQFPIAGEIRMGSAWNGAMPEGAVLRIPTGGVVPPGADAVVPVEDTVVEGDVVRIDEAVPSGDNVNPAMSDMRRGEAVLLPGRRLAGPQLGVLATLGVTRAPVYRRPVIAVLSSGDELVAPDREPRLGQVRDSNRYAIAGTLRAMGAEVVHVPTVNDEPGALAEVLRGALGRCDAAMLTGGSSVGERDRTPDEVASLGAPGVIVHGLRVKPGKPTVLAMIGKKPVIGLPGNPTSSMMILHAVAAPIVAALTGAQEPVGDIVHAVLDTPARSRLGWTWYIAVALRHEGSHLVAHPLPLRSSMVSLTARADGYLEMGEDTEELAAGTSVRIRRFR